MVTFKQAAAKFCRIRLTIGAIGALLVGIALIGLGIYVRSKTPSSSSYVSTQAVVTQGIVKTSVKDGKTTYQVEYSARYVVDGKAYTASVSGPGGIASLGDAQAVIRNAVANKETKKVYYDPANPQKMTTVKHGEKMAMWVLIGIGALSIGGAALTYYLRDNSIMCGLQVASNVTGMFRR